MKEITLQIALDLLNEDRALSIAEEAIKGDNKCWLEVGTPLIKSEGMKVVRKLKKKFPDNIIIADMKIMDTGALEVEMASKAGADVICVLAASDDSTIIDALKSARKYGTKIMVDLIGVKDKSIRAEELEKHKIEVSVEEGSKRHLKSFYKSRMAFELAFENGEEFKYSALNIGGLGAEKYGAYCVLLKREQVEKYSSLAFIKEDSLKYVDDSHVVNIEQLSQDIANREWQPKIVAFLCNWCSYGAADLAGVSRLQYPPYIRAIRVPCTGRMNPKFLLAAFRQGADGIWVSG